MTLTLLHQATVVCCLLRAAHASGEDQRPTGDLRVGRGEPGWALWPKYPDARERHRVRFAEAELNPTFASRVYSLNNYAWSTLPPFSLGLKKAKELAHD